MKSPDAGQHRASPPRWHPPLPPRTGPDDVVVDALLRAAGQGDVRALGAFYDLTAPAIYGLLCGVLGNHAPAEQATERVYLQVWHAAPRFDADNGSAYSLLMRAVHRELIHHILAAATRSASVPEQG